MEPLKETDSNASESSRLWDRAFQRYKDELSEDDVYNEVLNEAGSLQDVLDYAAGIHHYLPQSRSTLLSFNRLGPTLRMVDDFSAMVALCLGASLNATALIWGSIRLMLSLASAASDKLQSVLEMLEELSFELPEVRSYERTMKMTPMLELAIVELYTEIICFYARMIFFFRKNPHFAIQRQAWTDFEVDFRATLRRILHMSTRVKNEADINRMSMDKDRYQEVLDLVSDMKATKLSETTSATRIVKHYIVPHDPDLRFSGRDDTLEAVKQVLDHPRMANSLRTFSLYGMGGVGKTQVALRYAKEAQRRYDVVIWIAADTSYSIGQSARDAANVLGLLNTEAEQKDISTAATRLRAWLRSAECRWLLVLDNVDDPQLIQQLWPSNGSGSVLLTSRDIGTASNLADRGFHLQPFDEETASTLLLKITNRDETNDQDRKSAREIVRILGALPLAVNQIGSFILQRKLNLKDFPALYEKNANKIDDRRSRLTQYEKTLSNVWELSLSKLSGDAALLQGMLAFFSPDAIDEAMLVNGGTAVTNEKFKFVADDFDLTDAEEALIQAALIDKHASTQILTVHRLVQSAVIRRLSQSDRVDCLDTTIQILQHIFHGTQRDADVLNVLKSWTEERWVLHERCLPHVIHLIRQSVRYGIRPSDEEALMGLLVPCEISVRERELFELSEEINRYALANIVDKNGLNYASALYKDGLNKLNTGRYNSAVDAFKQGKAIREVLLGPNHALTAWGNINLGLCYTEMHQHEAALDEFNIALEIRKKHDPSLIVNSYSNLASLYLKMGQPDVAEQYLFSCPSLKDHSDESLLAKNNPRFAGNMVLLSRIRRAQERMKEALRLASAGLKYRRRLLGNKFTTCDSMHDVACLLMEDKDTYATADSLLQELVSATEGLSGFNARGQLARAYYRLSVLYDRMGHTSRAEHYKKLALEIASSLNTDVDGSEITFEEASFTRLCPWMMW